MIFLSVVIGRGVKATALSVMLVGLLAACAIGPDKPKPADLPRNPGLVAVRQAWTASLSEVAFSLQVNAQAGRIAVASSDGTVLALDAANGAQLWRTRLNDGISAGVGGDGQSVAVVTRSNQLVVLDGGKELWRQKLPAETYTAPLVAGGRVFVLAADRSVSAFDGRSGQKLWSVQRAGEPLVLRQAGVLLAVGDTLVVGLSGRLVGLHPLNGAVRWEAPIASPRGTNDIERLVDLVGSVARQGNVVCVRAFQASVGCVDATRGNLLWTRPAQGAQGLHGDQNLIVGTEMDSKLIAWQRSSGEPVWNSDRLQFRGLTAPLVTGRSIVVGDSDGLVHWLSSADGSLMHRVSTDGSAIVTDPVTVGDKLVVVTRKGGIYGFRTE